MNVFVLMAVAVLVGGLLPLQGSMNARLGKALNHPLQASFISFTGGALLLAALLVVLLILKRTSLPTTATLRDVPWYLYVSGTLGVIFVTMVIILAPRIGIANTLAAAIVGQLVMSVIFDHFGWLGLTPQPVSVARIVGCASLVIGLILIQKT